MRSTISFCCSGLTSFIFFAGTPAYIHPPSTHIHDVIRAFDATMAAKSRNADILLIDTAGRQQNQQNLMAELSKIRRSIDKVLPGAPHEVWLTVDSSLGANVISQAREFSKTAGVTGLVLTKLDGTGRGGMAVALHEEFDLPTFFAGFGEAPEDLQEFDPEFYAEALFSAEESL